MSSRIQRTVALICHPLTPSQSVRRVEARVAAKGSVITIRYSVGGSVQQLQVPRPRARARADRLWEHTCFEVFIALKGETGYYEFNFAPSFAWAVYSFRAYRDAAKLAEGGLMPEIAVRSTTTRLELDATIRVNRLIPIPPGTQLRLGLSAVLEELNGTHSYWALRHPPGKPDFHHPDAFALELPLDAKPENC